MPHGTEQSPPEQTRPLQQSSLISQMAPSVWQGTVQVLLSQTSPSQQSEESSQSEPAGAQCPTQTPLKQINPMNGQQSVSSAHSSPRSEQTAGTQRPSTHSRESQHGRLPSLPHVFPWPEHVPSQCPRLQKSSAQHSCV